MSFTTIFRYPNSDKPEFAVIQLQDGYQFRFFNEDGTEDKVSMFSITNDAFRPDHKAERYQGKQGEAIQIFREKYLI